MRAWIASFAAVGLLLSGADAFAQEQQTPQWPENPAKQADPPPIPPPPEQPPTSASGTDLVPSTPAAQPQIVIKGEGGGDPAAMQKMDAHMRDLEARLAADEERLRRDEARTRWLRYFKVGAYVQPQLVINSYDANASPNSVNGHLPDGIHSNDVIAKSDGTTTNGNMFRLRRTRLRTTFSTEIVRLYLEIDPLPLGGGTILRDAEATGIARWTRDVRTEFGAGVFMVPVSLELLERSDVRPFIERSWGIQNVFPGERDIGVHAKTFAFHDRLQVDVGVVNGQRLGQPHFVVEPDLNKSKDYFAHIKYRVRELTFGVAGYIGRGEVVDANELRFKQYPKWWVNYELAGHHRFVRALGETHLIGELAIAQNMDSGVIYPFAVPAIQQNLGDDVGNLDERSLVIRFEQELTRWILAGYRYDFYSTDTSIKNNQRDTHAMLIVARFSPNLRWMNEIDYAIDNIHPSHADAPARHILSFSSVLQAGF